MLEIKGRVPISIMDIWGNVKFSHFEYWSVRHGLHVTSFPPITTNNWVIGDDELFTGLRDKNGNELYEGDIYSCTMRSRPYSENAKTERITKRVSWYSSGAQWIGITVNKGKGYGYCFPNNGLGEDVEKIGNIHQNPEISELTNG